ncbi:hypothetical protein AAVH_10317 [Aphelenchoides avenae]|nr:hypothetical protein AAVH_10317 [Aphelenchus avenae]
MGLRDVVLRAFRAHPSDLVGLPRFPPILVKDLDAADVGNLRCDMTYLKLCTILAKTASVKFLGKDADEAAFCLLAEPTWLQTRFEAIQKRQMWKLARQAMHASNLQIGSYWELIPIRRRYDRVRRAYERFALHDVFDEAMVVNGAKSAFAMIAQAMYKNSFSSLVDMQLCRPENAVRYQNVVSTWSEKRRRMFDLSPEDIIWVAPGAYGLFQDIWTTRRRNGTFLAYRIHVTGLYRKKLLYGQLYRADFGSRELMETWRKIQPKYGFASPRTIHIFFDILHPMSEGVPGHVIEEISISNIVAL